MGVRLTADQKEKARKLFAADKSDYPVFDGLSYEFAAANKTNKSPCLAEEYHAALWRYHGHLRARLQIVKRRARFVKGC